MHEQSETMSRDGGFMNVYGRRTPQAGQMLDSLGLMRAQVIAKKYPSSKHGSVGESAYRWQDWERRGDFKQP